MSSLTGTQQHDEYKERHGLLIFFFFSLFDHCIHLKHGKHAVHKAQAQSVYVEINIELKHSPLMNKKKNKKKQKTKMKNGEGATGAAGLSSQLMKVMLHGRIQ